MTSSTPSSTSTTLTISTRRNKKSCIIFMILVSWIVTCTASSSSKSSFFSRILSSFPQQQSSASSALTSSSVPSLSLNLNENNETTSSSILKPHSTTNIDIDINNDDVHNDDVHDDGTSRKHSNVNTATSTSTSTQTSSQTSTKTSIKIPILQSLLLTIQKQIRNIPNILNIKITITRKQIALFSLTGIQLSICYYLSKVIYKSILEIVDEMKKFEDEIEKFEQKCLNDLGDVGDLGERFNFWKENNKDNKKRDDNMNPILKQNERVQYKRMVKEDDESKFVANEVTFEDGSQIPEYRDDYLQKASKSIKNRLGASIYDILTEGGDEEELARKIGEAYTTARDSIGELESKIENTN